MLHHWCPEQNVKPLVKWKDILSRQWKCPNPLLTSGQGYACIFPQDADFPIWVPDRLICHVSAPQIPDFPAASTPKNEEASSNSAPSTSMGNVTDLGMTDIGDPR